jgi:hypothetical protein
VRPIIIILVLYCIVLNGSICGIEIFVTKDLGKCDASGISI